MKKTSTNLILLASILFLHSSLYAQTGTDDSGAVGANAGPVQYRQRCSYDPIYLEGSGTMTNPKANWYNRTDYAIEAYGLGDPTVSEINQPYINISANASDVVSVNLDIDYNHDADLVIMLVAPNGSMIRLANQRGGLLGQDFTNTTFSSSATMPISQGSAPFTGTYLPDEPFSNLTGSAKGLWKLKVYNQGVLTGTVLQWNITFNNTLTYSWSPASHVINPDSAASEATLTNDFYSYYESSSYILTVTDAHGWTISAGTRVSRSIMFENTYDYHYSVNPNEPTTLFAYANYFYYDGVSYISLFPYYYYATHQWQILDVNNNWVNLTEGDQSIYSGVNSQFLHISNVTPDMDYTRYRLQAMDCGDDIWKTALEFTLRVNGGQAIRLEDTNDYSSISDFKIYPNPVKEKIYLETRDLISGANEIKIFNLNGQEVIRHQVSGQTSELEIKDLPSGNYLIQYNNKRQSFIKE